MSDNFVDIIGFQLEKVHTAVISWLLDSRNLTVPESDRILLLSKLLPNVMQNDDIASITPIQEYSFGRRRRIDLVAKVITKKGDSCYLLIECKTDSDVDYEQLQQSRDAFLKENPSAACSFYALTLGASQFTYQHMAEKIKGLGFDVLNVSETWQKFSALSLKGKNKIYDDWCDALKREEGRCLNVDKILLEMENPWDDRLKIHGYRIGFPIFYMFYAKLREQLDNSSFKNWAIYSGHNNPVMNWQDGWIESGHEEEALSLYWEFNWNSLILKVELGEKSHDRWERMKDEVVRLCQASQVPGRRPANRKGIWVSIYKWEFDFCHTPIHKVTESTVMILEDVHKRLRSAL
jgi:hypothetical protein